MALLPNLRTLRGHAVGSSSIIVARYDRGDRELEHLHLTTSEVDSEDLFILLHSSKPSSLKTFEYEVGDESVEQVEWQLYKITDMVASCARDSLETFRFVERRRAKRVELDGCRSFMGSLVCFSRLKHIHVECHMLVDRYNASRDHMDSVRHNLGAASVGDASETSDVGKSIVNWLPQSLETLVLMQRDDLTVSVEEILAGVEVGARRLPHLKSVFIHKVEGDMIHSSNWPPTTGGS